MTSQIPLPLSQVEEDQVIYNALSILEKRVQGRTTLESPDAVRQFLTVRMSGYETEVMCVVFLDTRHRVIRFDEMFRGTIDGATVYPRVIAQEALRNNAAAIICCHNHPSGVPEPSTADQMITRRIKDALALLDIRFLDHFVIGGGRFVSMAEKGMI